MHNFYCYRTSSLKAKSPLFSCLCASAKLYWQFDRNALYCNHKSPWRLCWPSCLLEGLERPKNGAKSATPGTQLRSLACFWNLNSESLSVSGFLSRHLLVCPQKHSQDKIGNVCTYWNGWKIQHCCCYWLAFFKLEPQSTTVATSDNFRASLSIIINDKCTPKKSHTPNTLI